MLLLTEHQAEDYCCPIVNHAQFTCRKLKKYVVDFNKIRRYVSKACHVYLHFFEDKFVPYAVLSDHTIFKFCLLSPECKVQQPFLQWCVGLTKYLQWFQRDCFLWASSSYHTESPIQGKTKITVTIRRKFLKMQQANTKSTSSSLNFEMLYLNSVLYNSLTLSNIRLSIRGTTGNTVGRSSFKSSIRSRMSPWKNPIRAPWTRMTPWWKESCLVLFVQFKVWHFVHMGAYSSHQIKGLLFCYLPLRHIHTGLILKINRLLGHLWITKEKMKLKQACYLSYFITSQFHAFFWEAERWVPLKILCYLRKYAWVSTIPLLMPCSEDNNNMHKYVNMSILWDWQIIYFQ